MFPEFYYQLNRYTQLLIIVALCLLAGVIARFAILKTLALFANRVQDVFFRSVYKRNRGSLFLFIPLTLLQILFPSERFNAASMEVFTNIIQSLIIVSFGVIAVRLVYVFQDVVASKYDISKSDNNRERVVRTQLAFVIKILTVVIVMLTISAILLNIKSVRHYGTALFTSAGVAGVVLGFAAQKSLTNVLAGFQIAFTQPIKLDDAVVIEGEWGWIEEISLTYVVVKIWDLRRLVIPITYFIEKPFQNWTRINADLLGSVYLFTDYSIPLDKLRSAFYEILESSEYWDKKTRVLHVTDATEKSMQLRLLMSARNSPEAWELRCEVREKMIVFIQQNYPESFPRLRAAFVGENNTATILKDAVIP